MTTAKILGIKQRIYPDCSVHAQATGRVGYVRPALPQMRDKALIAQVTPDVGHCWIGHDWSNIETWLLGALANDDVILEARAQQWDTHTVNYCDATGTPRPPILTKALHTTPCNCGANTIAAMCGTHLESCPEGWRIKYKWEGEDDIRRQFFKRFVYRLHYRGQAQNAGDIPGAKALGYNPDRLIAASEMYLGKHPALPRYWSEIEGEADKHGVIYTFMGRPRRLTSEYRNARLREACNHPMQGGVSDIWIETAIEVKKAAPWAWLCFGAYDSMWWQVPNERRYEFLGIYAPIVTREFNVNGRQMSFPASYKLREAA